MLTRNFEIFRNNTGVTDGMSSISVLLKNIISLSAEVSRVNSCMRFFLSSRFLDKSQVSS